MEPDEDLEPPRPDNILKKARSILNQPRPDGYLWVLGDGQVQDMVGRNDDQNIRWVWEEETAEWPGYWRQPNRK